MAPVRSDLGQRGENKTALVQTRMRQHEALGRRLAAIVIEEVEVKGPGGVEPAAPTPETGFERQQRGEQRRRGQPSLDQSDGVDVPGLIRRRDRL